MYEPFFSSFLSGEKFFDINIPISLSYVPLFQVDSYTCPISTLKKGGGQGVSSISLIHSDIFFSSSIYYRK